jgi:hypothetical protein
VGLAAAASGNAWAGGRWAGGGRGVVRAPGVEKKKLFVYDAIASRRHLYMELQFKSKQR